MNIDDRVRTKLARLGYKEDKSSKSNGRRLQRDQSTGVIMKQYGKNTNLITTYSSKLINLILFGSQRRKSTKIGQLFIRQKIVHCKTF